MIADNSQFAQLVLLAGIVFAMPLHAAELLPPLTEYVAARTAEFADIPAERRALLQELTSYIRSQRDAGRPIKLTFICTHNSRRSQMAQAWAAVAAAHYDVPHVETYSGGTEATAFNSRAVAALQRAGFEVSRQAADAGPDNPYYEVHFAPDARPLVCFSKVYRARPNPQTDFAAVMTCSDADENCPTVAGATARIALAYEDPKNADGTPDEAAAYDDRCRQIACEMLSVFSSVVEQQ